MTNKLGEIVIYQSKDGLIKIDVRMKDKSLWINQLQISELYDKERSGITKHINNIFKEGELDEKSNVRFLHIPNSNKPVAFYSLDVVIAVGYRVKSTRGMQFRQWATAVLHEYMQKGFAINDEKLKEFGGGDYYHELLERIRDIRAIEKAQTEYDKYKKALPNEMTEVEMAYLDTLKEMQKKLKSSEVNNNE